MSNLQLPNTKKIRPKIKLPVVANQYIHYPQTPIGVGYSATTPIPIQLTGQSNDVVYGNRASEFVFTQFKGIKDFTKSGLSVGEKSALWLYEKV